MSTSISASQPPPLESYDPFSSDPTLAAAEPDRVVAEHRRRDGKIVFWHKYHNG